MLGAYIGVAAGGGFFQMKSLGIATPAIITIVQYMEEGCPNSLLIAVLTILSTTVVTVIATLVIGFEDIPMEEDLGEILHSLFTTYIFYQFTAAFAQHFLKEYKCVVLRFNTLVRLDVKRFIHTELLRWRFLCY